MINLYLSRPAKKNPALTTVANSFFAIANKRFATIIATFLLMFICVSTLYAGNGGEGAGKDKTGKSHTTPGTVITVNPSSAAQNYGLNSASAALTVTASGTNLTYQWYSNTAASNSGGTPVTLSLGQSYAGAGGIVGYILAPGDPGYIAGQTAGLMVSPTDLGDGIEWGCRGTSIATSTAFGTGLANTNAIIAACAGTNAARVCHDLSLNGFSDWYLPSKDEMTKFYNNQDAIGGFSNSGYYWSSSQCDGINGTGFGFKNGDNGPGCGTKTDGDRVRAARSFTIANSFAPLTSTIGTTYYYVVVTSSDGSSATSQVSGPIKVSNTQTIIFNTLAAKTYGNADFSPGATASSGLTVSYSSDNSAVATIVSNQIHIVGPGTANITALQAGDASTLAATSVVQSLTVNNAAITVTANAASKIYGDADPALTYSITAGALVGSDVFSGLLTRDAGVNAGTYAINQGTLAINSKYTITFVSANLTVDKRLITIQPAPASKVYGDADPGGYPYYFRVGSLASTDGMTGSYVREPGEVPGTYALSLGTKQPVNATTGAEQANNYTITFLPEYLTIIKRVITLQPAPATKVYGDADPGFPYYFRVGSLAPGEGMTGTFGREPGENAGVYTLNLGTKRPVNATTGVFTDQYYTISFLPEDLTITKRTVNVNSNTLTKTYGDTEPTLTYTADALAFTDSFTGGLTRVAGEDFGTYAISQGTLALTSNYTLNFTGSNLTIGKKTVNVTANVQTKTYGDTDPALTYTADALALTDSFTGELTRAAGEDFGTYPISQGTLALNSNYTLNFTGADLSINKKIINVAANTQTKTYGDADPALTYGNDALAFSDSFTGELTRAAGEDFGTYPISQGTLALNSNYTLNFTGADLSINKKIINVTAAAQTKTYGDADPALTYGNDALAFSDSFTGELTRAAGEDFGTYAISQGTLALNSNYTLNFTGADLSINKKIINVTADAQTKTYGDTEPTLTYTADALAFTDSFTGGLTRAPGEVFGTYPISQGTLALNGNYTLNFIGADLSINKKIINVTAAAQTKTYGDTEPTLTYTADALAFTDGFTGELTRTPGEDFGTYPISQGTLALNANYTLNYTGADLTIGKKTVNVTANAQTKTYGDAEPTLTYTADALAFTDSFTGELTRTPGEDFGTYAISQGTLALNDNYTLNFTGADLTINKKPINVTAAAQSKTYGDADPALTYSNDALAFTDSFTGELTRTAGETAGNYAITQGTLALSNNYTVNYTGANLAIGKRDLAIFALGRDVAYGDADQPIGYNTSISPITGDSFTGELGREPGTAIGTYAITQNTLTLTNADSYNITFNSANYNIVPRPITVSSPPTVKVYGDADPALSYSVTAGSLLSGDELSGAIVRDAGETPGAYTVRPGTVAVNSPNYAINFQLGSFEIDRAPLTVKADDKAKLTGQPNPAFTYVITGFKNGDTEASFPDGFQVSTLANTNSPAGTYAISVYNPSITNYDVTYLAGILTVRDAAANANLTALSVAGHTISPSFDPDQLNYTLTVAQPESSIDITGVLADANARLFRINGFDAVSGQASSVPLYAGENPIQLLVVAEDNTTTKVYTLTVTRPYETDATLSALTVNQGTLSPAFTSSGHDYTVSVPYTTASVILNTAATSGTALVKVNGSPAEAGDVPRSLVVGGNVFNIKVAAQDRTITQDYTVTVTRLPEPTLTGFVLSSAAGAAIPLNAASGSNYRDYTATVPYATSQVTVTPTAVNAGYTVTVGTATVPSGSTSPAMALSVGSNTIVTTITDGITTNTYSVVITRLPMPVLASLVLSSTVNPAIPLSVVTGSNYADYSATVPNATSKITVTPVSAHDGYTITVGAAAVSSGAASPQIDLNVGANTINTTITDGTTSNTYAIVVTRAASDLSANASLAGIKVNPNTPLTTVSGPGSANYTTAVPNSQTSLTVITTTSESHATITVNGTAVSSGVASQPIVLSVGDNVITVVVTAQDGANIKSYLITANRAPSTVATLANLSLSTGALSPAFAPETTGYTATVANTTASIKITPTVTDANATIKVSGVTVASGSASADQPLTVGTNTITTIVTAQDGTTTQAYTLTVTRAAAEVSTNAGLSGIRVNPNTPLTAVSGPGALNYTTAVPNSQTSLTVTTTTTESHATIKVNGTAAASGAASQPIALSIGDNVITIVVTAQDGATIKTYLITATRAGAPVAVLSSLALSTGTLSPAFAAATTAYSATVSNATAAIKLTPAVPDANITIQVNGAAVASGAASASIPLAVGANTITAVATAYDGITTQAYTVTVTRAAAALSTNAGLSGLKLNPITTLTTVTGPGNGNYTAAIPNSQTSLTVTATTSESHATMKINGITVTSGTASQAIPLGIGNNVITVVVTAQDGATIKSFIITATRAASTVATLANLAINTGTLSPVFATATNGYTAIVPNAIASLKITPTVTDATATIKVNGTTVASGAASASLPLTAGTNTITTVVTAQDGTTSQTYTVTVTRAAAGLSTNAGLSGLKVNPNTALTTVTGPANGNYTTAVPYSESSLAVIVTASEAHATIKVNGIAVTSGTASQSIPLNVGDNVINIIVTAQDGVTAKSYIITATRAAASLVAQYEAPIDNSKADGVIVHQGVSPNGDGDNDVLTIDGITAYPDNRLLIMNRSGALVFEAKGYNNASSVFDGHSNKNGRLQQAGTYFYSLEYKDGDKTKRKTGFILLKY